MKYERVSDKIMVLGIDGMDPELTRYHLEKGLMPNLQKFLDRGSAREDLHLLGSHPTITPPMWTTLACGCHPYVHGVTDFWRQHPEKLDTYLYGLDSTNCQAEQIWNVFAEAGWNTLVWHWPGSSWPPTSDSPNLTVVDGTNPEGVNQGTGQVWFEFIAIGSEETEQTTYKIAAGETSHMCVITDLEAKTDGFDSHEMIHFMSTAPDIRIIAPPRDADKRGTKLATGSMSAQSMDISLGAIKPAHGWTNAPKDAKESTILFSRGLVRRPVLILKNEQGVYDKIALYKNKKAEAPIVILENSVFTQDIFDEAIRHDKHYEISRNMRVLELKPDGSYFRIWCSAETDINDNRAWSPQSLFDEIKENVGVPLPVANLGSADDQLIRECMHENWRRYMKWQADCLHYMIENKNPDIIFTHIHNDDAEKHMYVHFAREGAPNAPQPSENYVGYLEEISIQNDIYIGRFLHLLDEGWTILLVSDHGLTANKTSEMSQFVDAGINTEEFVDWGFTTLKTDENGALEVDWSKTKAIKTRMNEVYINLKGKYPTGIVEPEDKWELEEEIMTKMYSLVSPKTGHRMVSLALRNKDAVHFGLGGPECGDIVFFTTEGYNNEHGCGLSTTLGAAHTSQSPIFVAAGKGIKQGYKTDRVIREIDVAPTVAALGGVRMPANAEGAPVYQIFED
ncbi:MAG: alkaline phosphatase family protein [Peptococcaceae bacterium]|nr:alkaline phosphatase family protein [Peptococcaceae bacterium]